MHRAWGFLVELRFKVHRGLVAEGAVEPLPVVKDFDPLEDGSACLRPRGKMHAMHQLAFEAAPKAAKLKEPESKERKFEDVVKSAEQAAVLVLF